MKIKKKCPSKGNKTIFNEYKTLPNMNLSSVCNQLIVFMQIGSGKNTLTQISNATLQANIKARCLTLLHYQFRWNLASP